MQLTLDGLRMTPDLESVADRLAFVKPPFDLANVAASADAFHADLNARNPGKQGVSRGSFKLFPPRLERGTYSLEGHCPTTATRCLPMRC